MKSSKQISSIALLSLLVLTGCTNSETVAPKEVAPVSPATQDVPAPEAQVATPPAEVVVAPATPSTSLVDSGTVATSQINAPIEGVISYKTPAGDDAIKVSLMTKEGIITGVATTPLATNPISLKLQTAFAAKVSESVVGKAVKGLKVDTISGASLTTAAFNGFLAKNAQ